MWPPHGTHARRLGATRKARKSRAEPHHHACIAAGPAPSRQQQVTDGGLSCKLTFMGLVLTLIIVGAILLVLGIAVEAAKILLWIGIAILVIGAVMWVLRGIKKRV